MFNSNQLFNIFNDLSAIEVQANLVRWLMPVKWEITKETEVPVICICGAQNVGKSTLVESLIGERFNYVSSATAGTTKRPLKLSLLCFNPAIDNLLSGEESLWETQQVDPNTNLLSWVPTKKVDVIQMLKDVNKDTPGKIAFSAEPIEVRVKRRDVPQLNLIDLPGLQFVGSAEAKKILAEITRSYIKNKNAIVVCVEKADTNINSLVGFGFVQEELKDKEPNWTKRVILARTMLDCLITQWKADQSPDRTKVIANYFSLNDSSVIGYSSVPKFYLTLANPSVLGFNNSIDLQIMSEKTSLQDQGDATNLGVKNEFISCIGFTSLRDHLHDILLRYYRQGVTSLHKQVNSFDDFADECLQKLEEFSPTYIRLRLLGSVQEVIKKLEELLAGYYSKTSERYGRTFEEDLNSCFNVNDRPIEPAEGVPYYEYKLCGGGQYRRLIAYLFKNTANIDAIAVCKALCPKKNVYSALAATQQAESARLANLVTECLALYSTADQAINKNAGCIQELFKHFVKVAIKCLADNPISATHKWLQECPGVRKEIKQFFYTFFQDLTLDVKSRMKHNKMVVNPAKLFTAQFEINPNDDVNGIVVGLTRLDVAARGSYTQQEIHALFENKDVDGIYTAMGRVFSAYLTDQQELMQQVLDSYYKLSLFQRLAVEASTFYSKHTDADLFAMVDPNWENMKLRKTDITRIKKMCADFRTAHLS